MAFCPNSLSRLFMHSFNTYVLRDFHELGANVGPGDSVVEKKKFLPTWYHALRVGTVLLDFTASFPHAPSFMSTVGFLPSPCELDWTHLDFVGGRRRNGDICTGFANSKRRSLGKFKELVEFQIHAPFLYE